MCNWCPNASIDRTHNTSLSFQKYSKLIEDLSLVSYNGTISFSRYNEPFAEIEYFKKCIEIVRQYLPQARLVSNTNGDYLSSDVLESIDLDELTIMDYDDLGENKCIERMKKWGISIEKIEYPFIIGKFENMQVLYYVDWLSNGLIFDRGGVLNSSSVSFKNDKKKRNRPCFEPFKFVGIDFNGNVMPCCNLRSDNPLHDRYILGNIYEESIFEILVSPVRDGFLSRTGMNGNLPIVCNTCQKDQGRYTREEAGIEYE